MKMYTTRENKTEATTHKLHQNAKPTEPTSNFSQYYEEAPRNTADIIGDSPINKPKVWKIENLCLTLPPTKAH